MTRMTTQRSLLIKVGLLGGVMALILFIGWRVENDSPSGIVESRPANEEQPPSARAAIPASPSVPVTQAMNAVSSSRSHVKPAAPGRSKVDPNRATLEDLQTLPGIGPVLAQRVMERRTAGGPFRRLEDLLDVKGIGKKRLDRLRPFVVFESGSDGKRISTPTNGGLIGASRE
jgi:competence protein ComEA